MIPRAGLQLHKDEPEPQRGVRHGLWLFCLLVLSAMMAVIFLEVNNEQAAVEQSVQREADNLVRVFASHTGRGLAENERLLHELADKIAANYPRNLNNQAALHVVLERVVETLPELRLLWIADERGLVAASSLELPVRPTSVADRADFIAHRDRLPELPAEAIIHAWEPGQRNGADSMIVSVPIRDPGGRFRGALFAEIDPILLATSFPSVDLGPQGHVALIDLEGRVAISYPNIVPAGQILDWPLLPAVLNGGSGGIVQGRGIANEQDYFYAFRRMGNYPLVVLVGIRQAAIGDTIDGKDSWRFALFAVLGIGLIALTVALSRSVGQIYQSRRVSLDRAQALATVIDSMSDGLMLIDAEGQILLQNPKAVEAFGGPTWRIGQAHLPKGTTLLKPNGVTPLPDEDWPIQRALQGELVDQDLYLVRREGVPVVTAISGSARPIRDPREQVIGAVALLHDVTEQRQLDERLRITQRLEALGQLTGGVAHDFNNLLTVITGSAEELLSGKKDEATRRTLAQMILETAERGSRLTRHLLAFARQQILAPRPLDVNGQLVGLEPLLVRTLGPTIHIELKLASDCWPALADASQLETAVINLAINARDAMPAGGRLVISTACTAVRGGRGESLAPPDVKPGEYVAISVKDEGHGMSAEIVRRAFDPFFTTKDVGKGTGLGLSMVYGFAQQSGGFVTIDTQPSAGTTVHLHLPRAVGMTASKPVVPTSLQPVSGTAERILLVEDDPDVRRLVEEQLLSLGYRVTTASDGHMALELLVGGEFDLMLTDLVMPNGIDGLTLAGEARALRPDLKIILATGIADHSSLTDRRPDPSIRILPKPFRGRQLARVLREVLDGATAPGEASS